jgi:hypothetical protein
LNVICEFVLSAWLLFRLFVISLSFSVLLFDKFIVVVFAGWAATRCKSCDRPLRWPTWSGSAASVRTFRRLPPSPMWAI